jgi:zinc/manganese transport system substrate-binding protein
MKHLFIFCSLFFSLSNAFATLKVVTTTTDLSALVKAIGQDKVDVFAIAKGTQDPHQIEAKPSFMVKMKDADLVIEQGLELETAWILPLIQGSRNPKLASTKGVLELGPELDPLEIPQGSISRAEGDVHPGGNPHFQLDPLRLGKAAVLIAAKMGDLDPGNKDLFTKNAAALQKHLEDKNKEWQSRVQKTGITEIVTYHKTFAYFCARFNLKCTLQLEPKPGIPPTASHLVDVIDQMKKRHLRVVMIENVYDDAAAGKIQQNIPDAIVERVPVSVEGEPGLKTGEAVIERLVKLLESGKK